MTVIPSINQDIKMLSDSRYKLIKNSDSLGKRYLGAQWGLAPLRP